jgi:acetyl esterase/lipase
VPPHFVEALQKYRFAFISADYRLAPQVGVTDIFEDVKDCIAYVRSPQGLTNDLVAQNENRVIDTDRLAVSGSSAGGYLALLAGLYVDPKPKAIMPIYPITDPLGAFFITPQPIPMDKTVEESKIAEFMDPSGPVVANNDPKSDRTFSYFWMMQSANLARLLKIPDARGEDQDRWRISRQIRKHGLPPTYTAHGDADRFVGVEQSDEIIGVMVAEGTVFKYDRRYDIDHMFDTKEGTDLSSMYEFMMAHV